MNQLKLEERIIKKNTLMTMIINAFLAAMKMLAGIFGKSSVLISDAINSLGDIATNAVVYISAIFSRKGHDKDHPYGHEKIDSIISIFLGVAIIITAFEVGREAIYKLYDFFANGIGIATPKWYALLAAAVTIGVKEFLFQVTKRDAKKARSGALLAQAWDHRSDTIASFGAIVGISGVLLGAPYLDPIASLMITFFILRVGYRITASGVAQVVDKAADPLTEQTIRDIVAKYSEIQSLDVIKTRMFGMKIYVDLEVSMDFQLSLEKSHAVAQKLHDEIESALPEILHCMIHCNPFYPKK